MISHSFLSSAFNPFVSFHPDVKVDATENFIKPIINHFFQDIGGMNNFDELEVSKLKTEVEYNNDLDYVNSYLYKEVMDTISRDEKGSVYFKPKYSISFDKDLADCGVESEKRYPYKKIFNDQEIAEPRISYGLLRIGNQPVLYILYIELQQLIRYIKGTYTFSRPSGINFEKIENDTDKRNRLLGSAVEKKIVQLKRSTDDSEIESYDAEIKRLRSLIDKPLEGVSGKIRINLSWNTTDDLDLYVQTPNGVINYSNKVVVYDNVLGELDIDCNAGDILNDSAQENISWDGIPQGEHIVGVSFFKKREREQVRFTLTILVDEEDGRVYNSDVNINQIKSREITRFEFINGLIRFKDMLS